MADKPASAKRDAQRDMIAVLGRQHPEVTRERKFRHGGETLSYTETVAPSHHTSDSYHAACTECKKDQKSKIHPSAR